MSQPLSRAFLQRSGAAPLAWLPAHAALPLDELPLALSACQQTAATLLPLRDDHAPALTRDI